jgi:prepilin-type N-terminal cleavage/methylation domain-containing protein
MKERSFMNRKGITLIELIVVMVIITIGAVLIAPNIGAWLPYYRLRSATRDMVSNMRVAQIKAVSNNIQYGVAFNPASNQYQLYYQSTGGLVPEGPLNQLPTGIQFSAITIPVDPGLGLPFSRFYSNSASVDGNIVLSNTKGTTKTIQLLGTTGRIKSE